MMGRVVALLVLVALAAPRRAGADLTGKWQLDSTYLVDVVQSGSSLTFTFGPDAGNAVLTGSISGASFMVGNSSFALEGHVFPGETRFIGVTATSSADFGSSSGRRCQCLDGNTTSGDGCDASCQIEPCFTCTGDPSACSPSPDSAACDDGDPCTQGETCTAGACGGGSPVSPCVNLSGRWHFHADIQYSGGQQLDQTTDVVQTNDFVELHFSGFVGPIDPTTGEFHLLAPVLYGYYSCPFDPLDGMAALDARSLSGTGVFAAPVVPGMPCGSFPFTLTGSRCGNGTLEPGEDCDDGNVAEGDGCDASCHLEPCFSCSGEPSTCTPVTDGTPCTTTCATGTTCTSGTCGGGTPVRCGACETCDPAGAGCVVAPRPACTAPGEPHTARLRFRNRSGVRGRFTWNWRSAEGSPVDLGDPVASDDYAVCLFGPSPGLLFQALLPSGADWTPSRSGFVYRAPTGAPDGLTSVRLERDARGRLRARVKGKGPELTDRPIGLPQVMLPLPVRLQLQGAGGACIEGRYDTGGVERNEPGRFDGRAE